MVGDDKGKFYPISQLQAEMAVLISGIDEG